MNDDQLRDELERRVDSVDLPREWSKHDLLPAVMSGIETRPQRVATSRAPALAGLAGVVAIVLVLVVALPRSGPEPGAGTPLPGAGTLPPASDVPPSTITTMGTTAFAARLATGELNGHTLLITGDVVPGDLRAGPLCPRSPNDYCYVGTLAGSDVDLFAQPFPVPEGEGDPLGEGTDSWDWWRLRQAPDGVARTMTVSVNENGIVHLIGYTPQGEVATALGEFREIDISAVVPDEVRVVPAWLTADLLEPACPEPQEGTYISSLPGRFCGGPDWLYDRAVPPGGPHEAGLALQNGAYEEFAPNPTLGGAVGEPRSGAYVVAKRLEGDCGGDPAPCWDWEVVGRLTVNDGSTTAEPQPPTFVCDSSDSSVDTDHDRRPVVLDSTGLVESCEVVPATTGHDNGFWITHLIGDESVLHVEWSGNPCDLASTFTLSEVGDGFELNGRRPNVDCDQPLVRHAMRIHLSTEIDVTKITGSLPPDGRFSPPAVPPTGEPVSTPRHGTRIDCPGQGGLTLVDRTGWVLSCRDLGPIDYRSQTERVTNPDGNLTRLHVWWTTNLCAERGGAAVEIALEGNRFTVSIVERPNMSENCEFPGARAFELTFAEDVPASQVEVVTSPARVDIPSPSPRAVEHTCRIVSTPPINDNFVPSAVKIMDETGLIDQCEDTPVPADDDEPLIVDNFEGDPDIIRLTWASACDLSGHFTLRSSGHGYEIVVGTTPANVICDGFPVSHDVRIFLTLPIPRSNLQVTYVQGTAHRCGYSDPERLSLYLVDETGLVARCEGMSAAALDIPDPAVNPGGDPRIVRLIWTGSPCDADLEVTFSDVGDGYLAVAYEDAACMLSVGVRRSIVLYVLQDIDARSVELDVKFDERPR